MPGDLWEDSRDSNFLWNRVTQRRALDEGALFAVQMGDKDRSNRYQDAAVQYIGDPVATHLKQTVLRAGAGAGAGASRSYITECPATGSDSGSDSDSYGNDEPCTKLVDGAVILALVHSGWEHSNSNSTTSLSVRPTSAAVGGTVAEYNEVFCSLYPINQVHVYNVLIRYTYIFSYY
jgi:hypothetical protein